ATAAAAEGPDAEEADRQTVPASAPPAPAAPAPARPRKSEPWAETPSEPPASQPRSEPWAKGADTNAADSGIAGALSEFIFGRTSRGGAAGGRQERGAIGWCRHRPCDPARDARIHLWGAPLSHGPTGPVWFRDAASQRAVAAKARATNSTIWFSAQ